MSLEQLLFASPTYLRWGEVCKNYRLFSRLAILRLNRRSIFLLKNIDYRSFALNWDWLIDSWREIETSIYFFRILLILLYTYMSYIFLFLPLKKSCTQCKFKLRQCKFKLKQCKFKLQHSSTYLTVSFFSHPLISVSTGTGLLKFFT